MSEIILCTIGFTRKSAGEFFSALERHAIKKIIDVRLNNSSQLAGFAKKGDLEFFLKRLCNCSYEHLPQWAPTREMLDAYKKKTLSWEDYEARFNAILLERDIGASLRVNDLAGACLLCSEATPEHCHRRLVAEWARRRFPALRIIHL
ncbi:DUF488 family protein [Desulfolutivibrio sulfoxidireducens]|uniref:DUF488 domain-containing protein n=1 Tax=Desulfolutivibrio sulfoxidireducens TaxID=2773299 RepID=UPI001C4011D3|nr:DUF488 domain-containing protein [Desulfolutivibrio sulfoxidireducens]